VHALYLPIQVPTQYVKTQRILLLQDQTIHAAVHLARTFKAQLTSLLSQYIT